MARTAISGDDGRVVVVDRRNPGGPSEHGLRALSEAIEGADGTVEVVDHWTETEHRTPLVIGTPEDGVVGRLLPDVEIRPEGVIYRWCETGEGMALAVAGTDECGLMYALFELAERVEAEGLDSLDAVEGAVEFPDNEVRGVDRFLVGPVEDEWFYDDDFWEYYLDRLARCRYNRLVLTTGYCTSFMAPPYPFLVDVPGFPEVRLTDAAGPDRAENLERLRRIGRRCEEYGIEFVFATWQQQPGSSEALIDGLPEDDEDLTEYCAAGMRTLLCECPEIDGVQLRVNWESGVSSGEDIEYDLDHAAGTAEGFWHRIVDAIADADAERPGGVHVDLRAKGLTDGLVQYAMETGIDATVATKFWCESTGLPHHNVRMRSEELAFLEDPNKSRRYSYADFLEKPRFHDVLYRLWAIGTNRIFVWGDPDYARRFSHAGTFGDGAGFEVTPPLSVKSGARFGEGWPLFDDPDLRHYEWEDERYWAWYRLFGRLGYSRETAPDVWEREFAARFGDAAPAVVDAYRAGSKVLPLITAAHLTRHPATSNWAELDTGGALFPGNNSNERLGEVTYSTAEPSDPGLFYGVEEYVGDALDGDLDGRYTPPQVARWLRHLAAETRDAVERADDDAPAGGEYATTALDFRMLADLAEYHAARIPAAIALSRYHETGAEEHLRAAYASALSSTEHWESLADRGRAYHDDLYFAMAERGRWEDYLGDLRADLSELESLLAEEGIDPDEVVAASPPAGGPDHRLPFGLPTVETDVPSRCPAGRDVEVSVRVGELAGFEDVRLHYRHADQTEGDFEVVGMEATDRGYRATIPGEYVTAAFDLLAYVTATTPDGEGIVVPGIYHATHPAPYHVIETAPRE